MKNIIRNTIAVCLLISLQFACSSKPFYDTQDKVVEAAYNSLNQEMESGSLKEWATARGMKGSYTFKLTIGGKGDVVTVSTLERSEDAEVMQQNDLKNYVKTMRFQFKMPKSRTYQFPYEFKF